MEVVDSKYTVFDVLASFFAHEDPWVNVAALEVYVRRAYRAYNLTKLEYHEDESDSAPLFLSWDFSFRKIGQTEFSVPLQSANPSVPGTPTSEPGAFGRISSVSDMSYLNRRTEEEPTRKGVVVPCRYLDDADEMLQKALEVLPIRKRSGLIPDLTGKRKSFAQKPIEEELTNVINVVIRDVESYEDEDILGR
ncbi:hypothetical protein PC116_g33620, partial [Phytophthora cactorum]